MKNISLEEMLQKHFGLKGALYLKHPVKDNAGNIIRNWTINGVKAYDRFTAFLSDISHHVNFYINDKLGNEIGKLIEIFDEYEKSSMDL